MAKIPKKVETRIKEAIKKYSSVLKTLKSRDVNESDTVTIISDMLSDVFGYDKYLDITSEYAIRNTYCDLAIKQNGKVVYLIECKAIGAALKENYLRQAIDYSSKEGIDWCILTNGHLWQVHKVIYGKPVRTEAVFYLDFIEGSVKDSDFIEKIYMLSKEAISKSAIENFHEHSQLVNKFTISSILLSDDSLNLVRRNLKKLSSQVKVDNDTIRNIIKDEVLKRDIVESDEMSAVNRKVNRVMKKEASKRKSQQESKVVESTVHSSIIPTTQSATHASLAETESPIEVDENENIVE